MNQTTKVRKEYEKKFELHDLGKDEFTLCCNNEDGTCDGGISIYKENEDEARMHLKKVWSFIETSLQEAVKEEREKSLKRCVKIHTDSIELGREIGRGEERERIKEEIEDLKKRLPFTYHDERLPYKRACEDILDLLTQKT